MFPLSNFVYLFRVMFVFSMSIETTDDCGQDPYETGCLVETFPGLINIIILSLIVLQIVCYYIYPLFPSSSVT